MNDKRLKSLINNLEYCSVERAMKLFELEQEEMFHFLLNGSISCNLLLGDYEVDDRSHFLSPPLSHLDHNSTVEDLGKFIQHLESDPETQFETNCVEEQVLISERVSQEKGTLLSKVRVEWEFKREKATPKVIVSGVWQLIGLHSIESILNCLVGDIENLFPQYYLKAIQPDNEVPPHSFIEDEYSYVFNGCFSVFIPKMCAKQVVITKADLRKLYDALVSGGKELENIYNSASLAKKLQQEERATSKKSAPHGNSVSNAVKRESVLRAAIYVKVKFPEQCTNATKWANTIDEKAPLFWDEGEAPLANSTIVDLLREVQRDPK